MSSPEPIGERTQLSWNEQVAEDEAMEKSRAKAKRLIAMSRSSEPPPAPGSDVVENALREAGQLHDIKALKKSDASQEARLKKLEAAVYGARLDDGSVTIGLVVESQQHKSRSGNAILAGGGGVAGSVALVAWQIYQSMQGSGAG